MHIKCAGMLQLGLYSVHNLQRTDLVVVLISVILTLYVVNRIDSVLYIT